MMTWLVPAVALCKAHCQGNSNMQARPTGSRQQGAPVAPHGRPASLWHAQWVTRCSSWPVMGSGWGPRAWARQIQASLCRWGCADCSRWRLGCLSCTHHRNVSHGHQMRNPIDLSSVFYLFQHSAVEWGNQESTLGNGCHIWCIIFLHPTYTPNYGTWRMTCHIDKSHSNLVACNLKVGISETLIEKTTMASKGRKTSYPLKNICLCKWAVHFSATVLNEGIMASSNRTPQHMHLMHSLLK